MRQRCSNTSNNGYRHYGGRGIAVCDRWGDSFASFFADMGPRPSPKHSLDRYPDNDGNYEPDNCRWATPVQQALNTRRTRSAAPDREWLRQARIALGWSYEKLATAAGTSKPTIQAFERGGDCKQSTLQKCFRALEGAGVEFIDEDAERGPGVRLQKVKPAGKRK